jgi:diaminopimelate epimerase
VRALPHVTVGGRTWPATGVLVPNPHAVVFVDDLDDAGDLAVAPDVAPDAVFPDGVNVEFVVAMGPNHVAMRVHERGVGETLSCGTGACAVAWAARRRDGDAGSGETSWRVDVPGGTVHVTETEAGSLLLTGPADLVARGTVLLPG